MEKTVRLFDVDSYMKDFSATVVSCAPSGGGFMTVLDRTAFFPEEGGQSCDKGSISSSAVTKVSERDGVIYHLTDKEFVPGERVECVIDFDERYRKMQSHTGEHILCGVAHRIFGCENVGFHLSEEYVRVDFDVYLDREKVALIEREANRAIRGNHPVTAWYPDSDELAATEFRSKDGIRGDVRLVKIDGVDICACCAPHVRTSSEVGMLKVVDSIKYKGGTRLEIVCGEDAYELFALEHETLSAIASSFSVKREEALSAVSRMRDELSDATFRLRRAKREILNNSLSRIEKTDGDLCFFFKDEDPDDVREFLNGAAAKCRVAAGFIGDDDGGYRYVVRSDRIDLSALKEEFNLAVSGRGGGSAAMISGKCAAPERIIRQYFE